MNTEYDWDKWEKKALAQGVSAELANQGRAILREQYQHQWRNYFDDELEWETMIQLAINDPEYAMRRWLWLEISDGESEHMLDFITQETIDKYRTERK